MIETLIEAVVGAWRERGADGALRQHPAWFDLSADDRLTAYETTLAQRTLEAALDADGLSTTARTVLRQIQAR